MEQVSATNATQNYVSSQTTNNSSAANVKTSTSVQSVSNSSVATHKSVTTSSSRVMISMNQLRSAARNMKSKIIINHKLPDYVIINSYKMTMPQFLELLTTGLIKINKGINTNSPVIYVRNSNPGVETVKNTNFNTTTYMKVAYSLKIYIDKYRKVPTINTSSGRMQYNTLIYTYCKIIDFQTIHKRLPNFVSIQPWTTIIGQRPVYITSDNIVNSDVDNARINSIVKGLLAYGLYAKNWGLGPNTHYEVLSASNVPKNALVIDIYGGTCAGTIMEMGKSYYINAKDTKKVFTVFWNTALNINGLAFLRRAHDDSFTPLYGKTGGFTDRYDVDKDGKYEYGLPGREDGLARPDLYLQKYGYNYMHTSSIDAIVSAIYKLAFS